MSVVGQQAPCSAGPGRGDAILPTGYLVPLALPETLAEEWTNQDFSECFVG